MTYAQGYILEIPPLATNKKKRSIRIHNAKVRGTHTKAQWEKLLAYFNCRCVRCGSGEYGVVKDHIIPVYQGGCDCIHNLQPLCARCNASKGPEDDDCRPEGWQEHVFGKGCC